MSTSPRDDELISAVIDGEATPEEALRVESDPVLRERLVALRAAAGAVAQPVAPLDELSAARLRSVAAAAWDDGATPESEAPAGEARAVGEPVAARSRGRGSAPWLAVAAAVAVIVGLAGILGGGLLDDDQGDQVSLSRTGSAIDVASSDEAGAPSAESMEESPTAREPEPALPSSTTTLAVQPPPPPSDAGASQTVAALEVPAMDDASDLEEWAQDEAVTLRRAPSPEVAYGSVNERVPVSEITCPALPGNPIATGTVTFAGASAELTVWLAHDADGAPVVQAHVSDLATCVQLALTELAGP